MLSVKNLSFAYGDKNVLHDINLDVKQGEIVSVVGHNGAGKTTLLKCIAGVLKGVKGEIRFVDRPLINVPPYHTSRIGMSFSPDRKPMFPRMTVLDNLEMGGLREKDKKKLEDNQERVFTIFPILADLRARNAGVLSGGERQMLAMGIALMSSPKLILLDEPSAGLAPLIVQQMFGAIGKINREERISFLIVEQSVELVEQITAKVCLLKAGRVLFQGAPAALKHFIEETDLNLVVED